MPTPIPTSPTIATPTHKSTLVPQPPNPTPSSDLLSSVAFTVLMLRIVRRRRGCSLRGRRQVLGQIAVHRGQVFIRRFHPSADHIVDDVAPLVRCMSLLVPTLDAVAIAAQAQGGIPTLSFRQGWHITTLRWLARRRGTSRRGRLRGFQEHQQLWRNCGRVGSASRLYRRISVNAKNRHGQQYIDCTLNQFHNLD